MELSHLSTFSRTSSGLASRCHRALSATDATATSVLDNDLRRYLVFSSQREHSSRFGNAVAIAEIGGTWWATRVRDPEWTHVIPPQCIVRRDRPVEAFARTAAELDGLRAELMHVPALERRPHDNLLAVHGQPIIVRAARDQFHLFSTDEDEGWVRNSVGGLSASPWVHRTDLQERLEIDGANVRALIPVNTRHANRALTKVGLNFLAYALGTQEALLPLFHGKRCIVLNDAAPDACMLDMSKVRKHGGLSEDTSDGLAIASALFGKPPSAASALAADLVQAGKHVLALGTGKLGFFLYIALDGRPIARVPLLPRLPGYSIEGICAMWTIAPRRANDCELAVLPDERRRAVRRVFEHWASAIPNGALPLPSQEFVKSDAYPFVVNLTYSPTRREDDLHEEPEINDD